MKVAALILGILAGLSGLSVAVMGHALVGMAGGAGGPFFYLLPLASFIGGGLALNQSRAAGGVLICTALGWLFWVPQSVIR